MNLNELKATWKTYDDKIQASQKLTEQAVFQMIRDRSKGTLAKMAQSLRMAGLIMSAVVVFFSASIAGNAFDYPHWYFYIPSGLYMALAMVALIVVVRTHRQLSRVNLSQQNLYESLKTVLREHETAQAVLSKVWPLCMMAGFLFAVSMVARKFEAYGTTNVVLFLSAHVALILLLYAIARWIFRAFDDQLGQELQEHIRELDQLKAVFKNG